jgi:hypothetical protein
MYRHIAWACFAIVSLAPIGSAKDAATENLETRGLMHSIFTPLSQLIPASMDYRKFSDPKNRDSIRKQIDALVANADSLEKHAKSRSPGFRFLSHSLARDIHEVKTWFDLGRYDESRFVIHNLTEYCISCHSQQTGSRNFPDAEKFFAAVEIQKLPLVERAQLQVATRQFDLALATYEEFFASDDLTPAQMALMQAFNDYLKVSIRVRGDLKRPIPILEKWSARPGVPLYMKTHIAEWISALKVVEKKKLLAKPTLAAAKDLLNRGKSDIASARGREKLIYFISASSILGQLVSDPKTKSDQFAEIYYLLGVCESVIGRSFWISQSEFYLESAIRSAPNSTIAKQAYNELEEQIFFEFSGSQTGTDIPPDVNDQLSKLKNLAEYGDEAGPKKVKQ